MFNIDNLQDGNELGQLENVENFKIQKLESHSIEEEELIEELNNKKRLQEEIKLKHEQVILNLQSLLTNKIYEEQTPMKLNNSMSTIPSMASTGADRYVHSAVTDDDVYKAYKNHLAKMQKDIDILFLSVFT